MSGWLRALRNLRKNAKLTAIAVFSLSIAMALGVVSLGVSNTALLAPLPGVQPDRLAMIHLRSPGTDFDHISYPDFDYYRHNNHVFADVAAIPEDINFTWGPLKAPGGPDGGPVPTVSSTMASDNYFALLGLRPYLGRLFSAGDDASKSDIAVMTYTCWQRLGSDPNIVGKSIGATTIIGVAPREFTGSLFGIDGDLVHPLSSDDTTSPRDRRRFLLVARLKPGVSRAQAQADLAVLSNNLAEAYPKEDKGRAAILARATLLPPDAISTAQLVVGLLLALMFLVLLIACANVANLLLALAVGRRQEATIKLALGASRGRLIREFLTESAILCTVSGALGYGIAEAVILRYSNLTVDLPVIGPYPFGLKLHLDALVVGSTVGLMFIAILATGLPAALYASSPHLAQVLSGEIVVGGTRKAVRRNALVVVQVSVCTLVLVGMGLCQRSLYNLRHVNPGFSARNLVAETIFLDQEDFSGAKGKEFYGEVGRAVSALPGVDSVTLTTGLPLLSEGEDVPVQLAAGGKPISAGSNTVGLDYFATFGIPVLSGRAFHSADTSPSVDSLIVNHRLAEMLWPGEDPLGRVLLTGNPSHPAVVVGVVADGKYEGFDEQPQPHMYYALSQHYQPEVYVAARTEGDPRLWLEPFARAVNGVGLKSPLRPITLATWENLPLLPQRIVAGGVAGLSVLGLLLAIMGLFGAISYSVSERRKELGIRVALGAQRWHLLRMILRQTAWVAGTGVATGGLLGVAVTVVLRSQFFGIGSVEWRVLLPVAAGMMGASLAVAYLSARPWIKVDPMEAVRHG